MRKILPFFGHGGEADGNVHFVRFFAQGKNRKVEVQLFNVGNRRIKRHVPIRLTQRVIGGDLLGMQLGNRVGQTVVESDTRAAAVVHLKTEVGCTRGQLVVDRLRDVVARHIGTFRKGQVELADDRQLFLHRIKISVEIRQCRKGFFAVSGNGGELGTAVG